MNQQEELEKTKVRRKSTYFTRIRTIKSQESELFMYKFKVLRTNPPSCTSKCPNKLLHRPPLIILVPPFHPITHPSHYQKWPPLKFPNSGNLKLLPLRGFFTHNRGAT